MTRPLAPWQCRVAALVFSAGAAVAFFAGAWWLAWPYGLAAMIIGLWARAQVKRR